MRVRLCSMVAALALTGCGGLWTASEPGGAEPATRPQCDSDNGGIELPSGFCAVVVAEVVAPRHMAVAPNGDLYVSSRGRPNPSTPAERGGVFALRDTDGDGRADARALFGPEGGTGIRVRDGYLYFATNTAVLRYRLDGNLQPAGRPDTLVRDLPGPPGHVSKSIALGDDGALFVDIGSPGNACQPLEQERQPGVRGQDPCPQLATRGGVWRFHAGRLHQTLEDGERWATGIRNAVAFAWNPLVDALYAVQHGREQLQIWPGFTARDDDQRVAEELQIVTRGSDFGWPYCYYDLVQNRRVLAPEYGGNGREVGRCADKASPILTFPPHSGPNDLLFYTGAQFPERYHGGAFVAFHGAGSSAHPGYRVAFVPFRGRMPVGTQETFATGFAGPDATTAAHRPMGLAQAPDGSLYIADSRGGRIRRVMYAGNRGAAPAARTLASPPQAAVDAAIRAPLTRHHRDIPGGAHTNMGHRDEAPVILAAAALADNRSADQRLLEQMRYTLVGGNDITANGGYPAQHDRHVTAMYAVAKLTPRIWNQLTRQEQHAIDLLMKAALVSNAFTTSDSNPFVLAGSQQYALDGDDNLNRDWNPNYREGMVGGLLVGVVYFGGPAAAQAVLDSYRHSAFVEEVARAGLDNIHETFTWKATHPQSGAPTGEMIERAIRGYRYKGMPLRDYMQIYGALTAHTYGGTVTCGLNNGQGIRLPDGTRAGMLLSGCDQLPNQGRIGMLRELQSQDAGGPRSSTIYALSGFRVNLVNQYVLIAGGYWQPNDVARESLARMQVGVPDLWYRLEHGYSNYAKGRRQGVLRSTSTEHGFEFTRPLWESVVLPYHQQ